MGYFILKVKHAFSAARALRDYEGKCQNIHGHNFQITVSIKTKDDPKGYAVDFYEVKDYLCNISQVLDHQNLNEIEPFNILNPTTENLAKYIAEQLTPCLAGKDCQLISVKVNETADFSATYILS
jgi:6-pyruvoyltetrahydropterin/6-carboxytetrahydropterin synthase